MRLTEKRNNLDSGNLCMAGRLHGNIQCRTSEKRLLKTILAKIDPIGNMLGKSGTSDIPFFTCIINTKNFLFL